MCVCVSLSVRLCCMYVMSYMYKGKNCAATRPDVFPTLSLPTFKKSTQSANYDNFQQLAQLICRHTSRFLFTAPRGCCHLTARLQMHRVLIIFLWLSYLMLWTWPSCISAANTKTTTGLCANPGAAGTAGMLVLLMPITLASFSAKLAADTIWEDTIPNTHYPHLISALFRLFFPW